MKSIQVKQLTIRCFQKRQRTEERIKQKESQKTRRDMVARNLGAYEYKEGCECACEETTRNPVQRSAGNVGFCLVLRLDEIN
jgi:hypothetical protein